MISPTSERSGGGGETREAVESPHVHDVVTSQVQEYENKWDAPKVLGVVTSQIQEHENKSKEPKYEKMTSNPPEVSKHQQDQSVDDIGFARVGESELGMTFKFVLSMSESEGLNIRLQTLSMSSRQTQETALNLGTAMDNYRLFSATREVAVLDKNGVIVNRNGSKQPREMPTAEEWGEARVVNLIERKNMLLNDEAPNCPNLLILFLQRNSRLTRIPSSFFDEMPRLNFLDLSYTRIKTLPGSLFKLKNLQILLLRSCVCLDTLSAEVGNLTNLEVLDLLGTDLPNLPKEVGGLTKLRHLQMSFYQPDCGSSESELVSISELQALQGLSISVHPKDQHWARIVGDVIEQVVKLKKLSYLQFYFPSVEALVRFSRASLPLRRFSFVVGQNIKRIISRVPEEVETEYEKYDQCLRLVNSGNKAPGLIKGILESVTAFYLDHQVEIQSLSELGVSSFVGLKFCVLRECPNMQVVIIGEKRDASFFPKLEYLGLHYLWKLEKIWGDDPTPGSYGALKYLRISTCGKLEYVASHSVLQCLSNLETFIVEDCQSLKSIVKEDATVKGAAAALLPRLKTMLLRHLPELVALGRGLFHAKEVIKVQCCPKFITSEGPSRIRELKKKLSSFSFRDISPSVPLPRSRGFHGSSFGGSNRFGIADSRSRKYGTETGSDDRSHSSRFTVPNRSKQFFQWSNFTDLSIVIKHISMYACVLNEAIIVHLEIV
ncbi:probable disease resistance protein At4g27220 [Salvia miltiorrhiza]|uniref:probable disease resistance protein At4g27220 n=1 Tax=Salvia miltiorrhiza TaxID=226208 RepID=UPI0025AC5F58|nr:probable disease resistance protein At4g27220 [Salvia miltiorrhiza]